MAKIAVGQEKIMCFKCWVGFMLHPAVSIVGGEALCEAHLEELLKKMKEEQCPTT